VKFVVQFLVFVVVNGILSSAAGRVTYAMGCGDCASFHTTTSCDCHAKAAGNIVRARCVCPALNRTFPTDRYGEPEHLITLPMLMHDSFGEPGLPSLEVTSSRARFAHYRSGRESLTACCLLQI
jgi:hypothetical protein